MLTEQNSGRPLLIELELLEHRVNPHCVPLYLIPFEEDAFDFLMLCSTYMSKIGIEKN